MNNENSTTFADDLLRLPLDLVLDRLIQHQPEAVQMQIVSELLGRTDNRTARERDSARKRERRSEAARIFIPECYNPQRRERCLNDPPLFLKTYFKRRYKRPFGRLHYSMIDAIYERAQHGGKKAVHAPRSRGKTEITKGMIVFLICKLLIHFPLIVGATTVLARRIYTDVRNKFEKSQLLYQDFPEICHPVRELQGAPQRASRQHVDGILTDIVWKANEYLQLPTVSGSPYGGIKVSFFGLDAAFRGANIEGDRPDFIMGDDLETRESAKSIGQIKDRRAILDQDIEGLEGEDNDTPLTIVILGTCQNRYCLTWELTDTEQRPEYEGERYQWIEKWPSTVEDPTDEAKFGLWSIYIAKRKEDQRNGDRHGRSAIKFYLDNFDEMNKGCKMLAENFKAIRLPDGTQLVHSALQEAMNKIASVGIAAFSTEYMIPPKEEEIQSLKLTSARVMSRTTNLEQGDVPHDAKWRTFGLDLGKYASHWVDFAWTANCTGTIPDYGVMKTSGLDVKSNDRAIEHALRDSLNQWADEVVAPANPRLVLIDSGKWPQAVYEFCREYGAPFFPCKGWDEQRFRMPEATTETRVRFLECWAHWLDDEEIWLYNVQSEYWKNWLQERFNTEAFDKHGARVPGSMALFHHGGDVRRHQSFANSMVSEEEQLIPVEGKAMKRIWHVNNRHINHDLDAGGYGCAAAGAIGIRLVKRYEPPPPPKQERPQRTGEPYLNSAR